MPELTANKNNLFTTKLVDLIVPEGDLNYLSIVIDLGKTDLYQVINGE